MNDPMAAECERIEEDAQHTAKAHFEAAAFWSRLHFWLGVPTAVLAAVAGVSALKNIIIVAGVVALAVAALSAVTTFLNPSDRATQHHSAGTQYLSLRNQTRIFRTVMMPPLQDGDAARARILELAARRDELNAGSPSVPRWAYYKARRGIDAGEATYSIDKR